jgi:energy-coupling factor transporter ATP-binding protein EcfA2
MITEALTSYASYINLIAGGNEFLAGAIAIAIPGAIFFVLRSLKNVISIIRSKFFITITLDRFEMRQGSYRSAINELQKLPYHPIQYLTAKTFWVNLFTNRDMSKLIPNKNDIQFGEFRKFLGPGSYFLKFGSSLVRVEMEEKDTKMAEIHLRMSIIARPKVIKQLLTEFTRNENAKFAVDKFKYSYNGDYDGKDINVKPIAELCLDSHVKDSLEIILNNYLDEEKLKKNRDIGLPHRLVLLLHGEPGNGKSKLITSIAHYLNLNLNYVNVERLDLKGLQSTLNDEYSIHVFEDVHSVSAFTTGERKKAVYMDNVNETSGLVHAPEDEAPNIQKSDDFGYSVGLSDFLNVLNGIAPLDRRVLILTTNYIDTIDPAILRPGRIDYVLELPRISPETANKWLGSHIPDFKESLGFTKAIRGCDLHSYLVQRNDPKEIEKHIPAEQVFKHNEANVIDLKQG